MPTLPLPSRSVRRGLLLAAASLVAACGGDDTSGPPAPLAFAVGGPAQVGAVEVNGTVRCDYPLTFQATGGGDDDRVTLLGMTLEWRDTNGEPMGDEWQEEISAATLASDAWFGTAQLAGGDSRTSDRYAYWSPHVAFRMVHVVRYRIADGAEQSATYSLTCQ